ncbi:hypothetical protein HK096_006399, partial [Nowakowskiella sp. JEL0078]
MLLVGLGAAVLGSVTVGIGNSLQKYSVNKMQLDYSLPVSVDDKWRYKTALNIAQNWQPSFSVRFSDRMWLLGFSLAYLGELGGNWQSLVTPLGIVSVMVSALIAAKYLNETISFKQQFGYLLVTAGVLCILLAAPKPKEDGRDHGAMGNSVSEIVQFIYAGNFLYVETIMYFVMVISLFGAINVNCGKALSVLARISASEFLSSSSLIRSFSTPVQSATSKVETSTISESSESISTMNSFNLTSGSPFETITQHIGASEIVLILTTLVISSIVAQEYFKQMALGRFPISQFGPIIYATFNC